MFADCNSLNSILCSNICLEPTCTGLRSLQRGGFSRVAKYVHSITLTTPPSWAFPYKARCLRIQRVNSSKPWTEVLKVLGHRLEKVKLLSYDCEKIRQVKCLDAIGKEDIGMPWQLPRHDHQEDKWAHFELCDDKSEPTVEYHCKHATAVGGDKLITMVFACLAASGNIFPCTLASPIEESATSPGVWQSESPKGLKVDFDNLYMEGNVSYSGVICKDSSIATKRHERDMSLEHWWDANYGMEAHFCGEMPLGENKALLYLMGRWEPKDEQEESGSGEEDSRMS
ncbi:hypothetical protein FAGAP_4588 [Fusarium agapanthi]|uniref:Uncharacterized protein n=1 Tax=Fusarium agapanthi TaxID=1803897 RepID=A0A9P5BD85_9HYPO|nr:hypothetical protein FAGAP_4588 [Fusarium agapanthi]